MIIRVLEGVIAPGAEFEFSTAARSFLRRFYDAPGLRRARLARRTTGSRAEFVWIGEWDDVSDIALPEIAERTPAFVAEHPDLVESWTVRHFEVFDDFMWDEEEDDLRRLLVGGSR